MKISTIYSKLTRSVSMLIGVGVLASAAKTGIIKLSRIMHRKFGKKKKQGIFPLDVIMKFFNISGMSKEKNAFLALSKYWVYGTGLSVFRGLIPLIGRKKIAVSPFHAIVFQLLSTVLIPLIKSTSKNKFNIRFLILQLIHQTFYALTTNLAMDGRMKGKAYGR
jgi:hypothetical protein